MPPRSLTTLILAILMLSASIDAAEPTTRPIAQASTTPAEPRQRPALIDPTKPAFVPKFAQVKNPPAGNFAERQYADQYTYPASIYGFGCGYYGSYGCGFGGYFGGGGNWSGGTY